MVAPNQKLYHCLTDTPGDIEKPIAYSICKAGVLNMTRHLASLYGEYNIRVNTLSPGGVFANNPDEFTKQYSDRTILGRMAKKDDYIGALLFLLSDSSSYMTGANLVVDGGWTAL